MLIINIVIMWMLHAVFSEKTILPSYFGMVTNRTTTSMDNHEIRPSRLADRVEIKYRRKFELFMRAATSDRMMNVVPASSTSSLHTAFRSDTGICHSDGPSQQPFYPTKDCPRVKSPSQIYRQSPHSEQWVHINVNN